jgi:uncharacterized protein YutD
MKLELDLSALSPTTRRNVLDAIEKSLSKDWGDITWDLKGFWKGVDDGNESKQQMLGWQKAVRELRDYVVEYRRA